MDEPAADARPNPRRQAAASLLRPLPRTRTSSMPAISTAPRAATIAATEQPTGAVATRPATRARDASASAGLTTASTWSRTTRNCAPMR
ncbi:hypothetical protein [Microbacterium sp. NIBRBAC000506063]|uniref:hypothetical protein n=1 Tax=Microbacterium sp. NIBRBAC000506063 TaxID=2734618 RepID=UPI001CB6E6EC|nr:hypothetical protein [Microbacterium sp. NIBRBAC000506063]